ncbi:hypothetical protein M422DRAFT_776376 [Sphaerobolus stellatus SS14]|nr:hypothetical protein M422DRAFT_776376 [Sphaerobolus stellatus SS14]
MDSTLPQLSTDVLNMICDPNRRFLWKVLSTRHEMAERVYLELDGNRKPYKRLFAVDPDRTYLLPLLNVAANISNLHSSFPQVKQFILRHAAGMVAPPLVTFLVQVVKTGCPSIIDLSFIIMTEPKFDITPLFENAHWSSLKRFNIQGFFPDLIPYSLPHTFSLLRQSPNSGVNILA